MSDATFVAIIVAGLAGFGGVLWWVLREIRKEKGRG